MPLLQKRIMIALALLLFFQAGLNTIKYFTEIHDGGHFGGDFGVFWQAGKQALENPHAIYNPMPLRTSLEFSAAPPVAPFVYPPTALLALWPLGYLSYNQAALLWTLLPGLLYLVLIWLLLKPDKPVAVLIIACLLPFLCANAYTGQTGAIVAVLFLGSLWGWKHCPVTAGICIGLMSVKPQLALLLPFALIASRQWRILTIAIITAGLLFLASVCWLGEGIWVEYLYLTQLFAQFMGKGIAQYGQLATSPYISLLTAGVSPVYAGVIQGMITLLVLGAILMAFATPKTPTNLAFGLLACGALIASPYTLSYDSPILACAMIAFLPRIWRLGFVNPLEIIILIAVLVMPYAQPLLATHHVPFATLAVLGFFIVLWHRWRVEIRG